MRAARFKGKVKRMAEFSVKTNTVRTTADEQERMRKELENVQQIVREISGGLVIRTAAATSIKRRLNGIARRVENHQNSMGNMKNALEETANLYEGAERNICGYTGNGIRAAESQSSQTSAPFLPDLAEVFRKITGKVSEIVQGFFSSIKTAWSNLASYVSGSIGKGDETDSQPTAAWGTGQVSLIDLALRGAAGGAAATTSGTLNNTGSSTTASGASKYRQPDYTQKNLAPDANGVYGPYVYHRDGSLGRVAEWNVTGQLSCTYYTLRKLNERGLSYPCVDGPGNGSKWYANFDHESGLPNYGGNGALTDLANTLTLPQENIVVSFDNDPSGKGWGHVLLVDEMYRDGNGSVRVKYSDNYPNITSLNGSNPQKDKTLEEFMSHYNKYNGNINGAVVMGAGN